MGILTSEEIIKKTDNYEISKLSKIIIQTLQDEILIMKDLLDKNK